MKRLLVASVITLLGWNSRAQVSIGAFIESAKLDPAVMNVSDQLTYLQKRPYRLAPLQRVEIRTQNRELERSYQEYALRFTPSNPWEVRSTNNYFESYQSMLKVEHAVAFKEAIRLRYYAAIDVMYLRELQALLARRTDFAKAQLEILANQTGSDFFDADDYADLQVDVVEYSVKQSENDFDLSTAVAAVSRLLDEPLVDGLSWDFRKSISVAKVRYVVDSLARETNNSLLMDLEREKIRLAEAEYKLERTNINTGFLQTEFDNRRRIQERTPFNISLGITLPIFNPNKGDMAKRQLDVIDAKNDYEEVRRQEEITQLIARLQLENLMRGFDSASMKLQALEQGDLAKTLGALKGGNPRTQVRYNANLMRLRELLAKMNRDLLFAFVDFLFVADALQQQPLVNFLSEDLETID